MNELAVGQLYLYEVIASYAEVKDFVLILKELPAGEWLAYVTSVDDNYSMFEIFKPEELKAPFATLIAELP